MVRSRLVLCPQRGPDSVTVHRFWAAVTGRGQRPIPLDMTATAPPPLVVRTESEVLDAIPTILGFHPADSVVVLLATPGDGVILTARVDLHACLGKDNPTQPLSAALRRIGWRPDLGAIVVGYGDNTEGVRGVVGAMLAQLPATEIFGAVVVGDTWWFHDDGPHDPGRSYDPRSSEIGAAAAYAGQSVLGSREDVEATLDPPGGRRPAGVTAAFKRAKADVSRVPDGSLYRAMDEALDAALAAGHVDIDQVARLAMLARRPAAREAYWQRLDRVSGGGFVRMMTQVVRATPRQLSVPVLCMLALAAWQSGEGVLLTICLDRAVAISPRHELVEIVAAISVNMLPPQLWEEMRSGSDLSAA